MANNSTVTVTGKTGPNLTVTAQVFTNVDSFSIDCNSEILTINHNAKVTQIDIGAQTTITVTVSGNTYTVEIT